MYPHGALTSFGKLEKNNKQSEIFIKKDHGQTNQGRTKAIAKVEIVYVLLGGKVHANMRGEKGKKIRRIGRTHTMGDPYQAFEDTPSVRALQKTYEIPWG